MKTKTISLALCLILLTLVKSGCGHNREQNNPETPPPCEDVHDVDEASPPIQWQSSVSSELVAVIYDPAFLTFVDTFDGLDDFSVAMAERYISTVLSIQLEALHSLFDMGIRNAGQWMADTDMSLLNHERVYVLGDAAETYTLRRMLLLPQVVADERAEAKAPEDDEPPWWYGMTPWESWEYDWTVLIFNDPLGRTYEEWWDEERRIFEFSNELPPTQLVFMTEQEVYASDTDAVVGVLTFDLARPGYRLQTIQPGVFSMVKQADDGWHRVRTWLFFGFLQDLYFMLPITEDSYRIFTFETIRLHSGYFEPGIYRLMVPVRLHWVEDVDAEQWYYDWQWSGYIWAEFTVEDE